MTRNEIDTTITELLHRIAPEADLSGIDPGKDLRSELDLDSFDFLNLIIGITSKLGVEIPESDYGRVTTLAGLKQYIEAGSSR